MKDFFAADAAQHENKTVISFFLVAQKQLRTKRENGEYLSLQLSDKTGQMDARMWENFETLVKEFEAGDVVKVQATVCRFADKLQLRIEKIRKAAANEFELADLVPHTEHDINDLWSKLNGFVSSFTDTHLHALVRSFLDDEAFAAKLKSAPAAKGIHHAYIGGLLEHIVSVLGLCEMAASHYPHIHRDLLMTGAIFHDIGKLQELEWGSSFEYTLEGQLLGHINIGMRWIDARIAALPDFPDSLRLLVQHIVLSHHGRLEFGSPKLPMIPEAILLNYLDELDAKMQTVQNELRRATGMGRGPDEMTEWVRSLERPLLNTRLFLATRHEPEALERNENDGVSPQD